MPQKGKKTDDREHPAWPRLCVALLLMTLSACATPQRQEVRPPIHAPQLEAARIIASDGAALPLKKWLPKGQTDAVVLALHGFNDYSNAFAGFGTYMAKRKIAVYAYDQRGFGAAPQPGIWGARDNLTGDLAQAVSLLRMRYPAKPLYLLGDSMGGAVAIAALTRPGFPASEIKGVVLVAPALWGGDAMNWFYRAALWGAAHTIPAWKVTGEGLRVQASDNIPMLIALGKDPLIIKATRIDALYGLVRLMGTAQEEIAELPCPALLLYGAKDQIIPPASVIEAEAKIRSVHRWAIYREGWHMLLRDLQAPVVWRDIAQWIERPQSPLPSGEEIIEGKRLKDIAVLPWLKAQAIPSLKQAAN